MSEQCALCTDANATDQIESPTVIEAWFVQESGLDVSYGDVVVPLCEGCWERVDDALAKRTAARGPGTRQAAERRLIRLAEDLSSKYVAAAST